MASLSRCRLSISSLRRCTSLLSVQSKNQIVQSAKCTRTICCAESLQATKTSVVQAVTKRFSSHISKNFQEKFPPVLGCNVLSVIAAENLVGSSELEEGADSEDEATSGRKRIRYTHPLDDVP